MSTHSRIDWTRVQQNLRCPICGDRAQIEPESDGMRGFHVHTFEISREKAEQLSRPSRQEAIARISVLKEELEYLRSIVEELK